MPCKIIQVGIDMAITALATKILGSNAGGASELADISRDTDRLQYVHAPIR